MFGCLKKFIFLVIIILAVIGFFAIGGMDFVSRFIENPFSQPQKSKMEKAAQIADFSKIDKEFELVSSAKLPRIGNYVYVKHGATSQRFYFSMPTKADTLTKADFNTKEADVKILTFVKDFKVLQFENFSIKGHGSMQAMGQTIPYIKFEADIVNLPIHGMQGIIGVAAHKDKNVIIIAMNTYGKYSQIITNVLLNELK